MFESTKKYSTSNRVSVLYLEKRTHFLATHHHSASLCECADRFHNDIEFIIQHTYSLCVRHCEIIQFGAKLTQFFAEEAYTKSLKLRLKTKFEIIHQLTRYSVSIWKAKVSPFEEESNWFFFQYL